MFTRVFFFFYEGAECIDFLKRNVPTYYLHNNARFVFIFIGIVMHAAFYTELYTSTLYGCCTLIQTIKIVYILHQIHRFRGNKT